MRTLKGLVNGVVLLCVFWVMPVHATVDWQDGFEYANDAALGTVWTYSCLGNPGVSSLRPFSGSKSLRLVYTGHVGPDPGAGGCFIDRNLNGPSETLYTRIMVYAENFTYDQSVGTKLQHSGEHCCYPSFWWNMPFGSGNLGLSIQGIILDNGAIDTVQVNGGGNIPQNQWVCMETRITMSTPGVDNGIVQSWINGVQGINITNQRLRAAMLNQKNNPTAAFRLVRLYTQHGRGVIYYDDFAVSRDARIGCTGFPPGDIQAPRAPSNFSFR